MPINYRFQFYRVLLGLAGNELLHTNKDLQLRLPELKTYCKAKFFEWLEKLRNDDDVFRKAGLTLPPDLSVDVLKSYVLDKHDTAFWRDFCESKRYVILYMNPLWKTLDAMKDVDELQLQMRQILWKKREKDLIKKRTRTLDYRPFDNSWYPDEWFLFLYFGLPSGEENCLNILREDKGSTRIKAISLDDDDSSDEEEVQDFLELTNSEKKRSRQSTDSTAKHVLLPALTPAPHKASNLPANTNSTLSMLAASAVNGASGVALITMLANALDQQTKLMEYEAKKESLERLVEMYTQEGNAEQSDLCKQKLKELLQSIH